jgi:predicted permease
MTSLAEITSDVKYRLRALFRREEVERELDDELRFHVEREAEKHKANGVPEEEALRRARLAFGGVEQMKEKSRDARGLSALETVRQDLRYALRSLRRNPGFTLGVILTLGLGIGANTAMFSVVDRLLFRSLPMLRDPDQVHRVYMAYQFRGEERIESGTQYTRYLDFRHWTHDFSQLAAFSDRPLAVGTGSDARERQVSTISASTFDFFDAKPVLGRFFTAQEDTVPIGAMVAVLGYGFWQTNYGGRADVLGQQIEVGAVSYTIIGVAPRDFVGTSTEGPPAVFVPITAFAGTFRNGPNLSNYYTRYNWSWLEILARRKPGVRMEQANADLSQAFLQSWNHERSLDNATPAPEIGRPHAIAGPVQSERGPNQSKLARVATWVGAVAAIVLLIACANVANLLLARAIRRRREIAVRLALGVSLSRLVRQLLTETLLLAVLGGMVGILVGYWGGAVLRRLVLPDHGAGHTLADGRTLWFAVAVSLIAGLITGLAPVLQARRTDLSDSLKAGMREGVYRRSKARTGLLLLQAALSVVLLVGAGLFVRSLKNVQGIRLGYDVDPVLYVYPNMRSVKHTDADGAALRQRLLDAAKALPGVENAALGLTVPFWDTWTENLIVAGIDSVDRLGSFTLQGGTPEYLSTVGTRIIRGRGVEETDRKDSPPVVIVSQAMAQTLWPGQDALGKCMRMGADTSPCMSVVGVAEDIKQNSITDEKGFHYYLPLAQYHPEAGALFVRVKGHARDQVESVRKQLQALMPGDSYITVTPMHDIVDPNVRSWQLGATMFLAFGGLALVLAAIGLYSVIAYDVAQRTHELGVRIALGAGREDVVRLVLGDGLRFALIGIALGSGLALWTGHWIEPLLYLVSPRDPLVFGIVTGALLLTAGLASALPALRAARVDPTVALRAE